MGLSMFFYITKYTLSSLFLVLGAKDVFEKMAFAFVINVGLWNEKNISFLSKKLFC